MRLLLPLILALSPLSALAWSVVVPTSAELPCVEAQSHRVDVIIAPDQSRSVTEYQFVAQDDGPVLVIIPELAAGDVAAWLDDAPLDLRRKGRADADDFLVSLALSRVRPTLLQATGHPLRATRVELLTGAHTLRVEAPVPVDWDAATPHAVIPLRSLGTACHRIPVQVSVSIETDEPLGAAFTPFHDVQVVQTERTAATLTLNGDADAARNDLHLYLATSEAAVAADALTYRPATCGDTLNPGYLLVAAGPTTIEAAEAVPKDLVFVIDRSGSMEGEKIDQVRRAMDAILDALGPDDRFDVITFNGGVAPVFGQLKAASDPQALARARAVVSALTADGGTDIERSLRTGLAELSAGDHDRPRLVVFLTDGLPTAGETDIDAILSAVDRSNEAGARVFPFGVGHDVNTRLLDELGRQGNGTTQYIQPGQDIDTALVDFFSAIQAPVLTDLSLHAGGFDLDEMMPRTLPDLYLGSRLLISAQYGDSPDGRLELHGRSIDGEQRFAINGPLLRRGEAHSFLPRLWASRRMAELLYEARQNGGDEAQVDEIQALAWRYGFVTRFTQFQVADDGRVSAGYSNPTGDEVGSEAVGTSSDINAMSENGNAGNYSGGNLEMVQVADRTFVHDRMYWRDTTVPGEPADVLDVRTGSPAWRDLLDAGAVDFLSVGRNVMFQWRCRTVRVSDPELFEDADAVPDADALPADLVAAPAPALAMGVLAPEVAAQSKGCAVGVGSHDSEGPAFALAMLFLVGIRRRVLGTRRRLL